MMRRYAICVSLAHLLLLGGYVRLGAIRPWQAAGSLFGGGPAWTLALVSAALAPFVLGATGALADAAIRRSSQPALRATWKAFYVVMSAAAGASVANAFLAADADLKARVVRAWGPALSLVTETFLLILVLLFVLMLSRRALRQRLVRACAVLQLVLFPATLLSVGGTAYLWTHVDPPERSIAAHDAGLRPATGSPRAIIVLLFDAWTYAQVFDGGRPKRRYPALQALAAQAIVFHNDLSFLGGTERNVPILLTGMIDPRARRKGTASPNIFEAGRAAGYHVLVYGSALRYCSIYVRSAGDCVSEPWEWRTSPRATGAAVLILFRLAAEAGIGQALEVKLESLLGGILFDTHGQVLSEFHQDVLRGIAPGTFVYAHYMLPHLPYVRYDPASQTLRPGRSYADSLQAVDAILSQVRRVLIERRLWEEAMLIVTSDHPAVVSAADRRVPLLIKMPGQHTSYNVMGQWNHAQLFPLLQAVHMSRTPNAADAIALIHRLSSRIHE